MVSQIHEKCDKARVAWGWYIGKLCELIILRLKMNLEVLVYVSI